MISVSPEYAEAEGGTKVLVHGEGLALYNGSRCRFGHAAPSPAKFVRTNLLECVAPPSPTGGAETCTGQALEIDLLGNGAFTNNIVTVKRVPKATVQALRPARQFRAGGVVDLIGHSFVNTSYLKCKFFSAPHRKRNDEQITRQVPPGDGAGGGRSCSEWGGGCGQGVWEWGWAQTRGYSRAQRLGLAVRNRAPSSQPAVRNRALPLHLAVRNRAFIFLG